MVSHVVRLAFRTLVLRPAVIGPVEPTMRARELKQLLSLTRQLTPAQREQLMAHLGTEVARDELAEVLQRRTAEHPACPQCACAHVTRYGQADGLQRYKCKGCRRTFNALTGTPLARLRQRDKWLAQAQAMDEGLAVRKVAQRLGVHRTTAFRWRHRFLRLPAELKPQGLTGVVEADETYLLRSFKGQPKRRAAWAARPPRRRGGKATKRGVSSEQVPVLVVRNRAGQTTDQVVDPPSKQPVVDLLSTALAADAVLCTDGSKALVHAAEELRLEHQAVNHHRDGHTRGAWHTQNVSAYHARFKLWLLRFRGVATSYLAHYLGWFRALDRAAQARAKSASFLALAVGA